MIQVVVETLLFILPILILLESIFSMTMERLKPNSPFWGKVRVFNEKYKLPLYILTISLLVASFLLGEISKHAEKNQRLESEKKVLQLEKEALEQAQKMREYREKLNEANSIIKSITIRYSVGFEASPEIFSESLLLGAGVVYARIGPNVPMSSNGVTFRFIPQGANNYIIELNAGLQDGDFPHGSHVEIFKQYHTINIFVPLLRNRNLDSFIVKNYSIQLAINGINLNPIVSFDQKRNPIDSGNYSASEGRIFGNIEHKFKDNLFEDLQIEKHLKTY